MEHWPMNTNNETRKRSLAIIGVITTLSAGLALIWHPQHLRRSRRQSKVVAALRASEEATRASERQMRALVTSLDDLVFELDAQGICLNL